MYRAIIIDDEEAVRTGLRSHFDWDRHGVSVAAEFPDCEKAYRYIREHPVELVVTDVVTPHMDGITLARKLRSEFPAVQIVFISGHADVQFLREAMKSSAIDYILKSVDMDELSAAISRVVERLEKEGAGLNLTWEVRNGIACHTKGANAATLEGQLVRLADHIAYINHDIEDALRGGIIYPMDIPLDISHVLGFTHSKRIDTLVSDAVQASQGQSVIRQSPQMEEAMLALKEFMFASVYTNPMAKGEEGKAQDMLRRLFEYYQKDPDALPSDFQAIRAEEGIDRAVCDYIAGMTDPFAMECFKALFIPKGWTVL